jgi:two-component system OmpR family response regulator
MTQGEKARILCVDDDPDILAWMRLHLEGAGYEVRVAGQGKAALLEAPRVQPHWVLLDVTLLGEIRDREIAVEIHLTGHLPLFMLHTHDSATTVTRFLEMGIEPDVINSFRLLSCVRSCLRRLRGAVKGGMTALFWDAMEKVTQGLCSVDDALADVRPDEFDSRPAWMRSA